MSLFFIIVVTFNCICIINFGLSLLISTVILTFLIKSFKHNNNINSILFTNCYIAMFSSSLIAVIVCIFTLKGDYEIYIVQETFSCRILGYMLYVSLAATMNAFSLQVC